MGDRFEVWVYAKDLGFDEYKYAKFWSGKNFFLAIFNLVRAKRQGYGCVKFYWR